MYSASDGYVWTRLEGYVEFVYIYARKTQGLRGGSRCRSHGTDPRRPLELV